MVQALNRGFGDRIPRLVDEAVEIEAAVKVPSGPRLLTRQHPLEAMSAG